MKRRRRRKQVSPAWPKARNARCRGKCWVNEEIFLSSLPKARAQRKRSAIKEQHRTCDLTSVLADKIPTSVVVMSDLNPIAPQEPRPIVRSEGVTETERYLKRLCDRSFLSLWSYSGVFRDQGRTDGRGDGKEVADLLVVFENHIIIFSDKHIRFPRSGDLKADWSKWFKKAVLKSAKQVWGAERWLRDFANRLFLDRQCTVPFPIDLPDIKNAIFHRIVVAHDASRCCQERLGGSGSLMIESSLLGDEHLEHPFTIGRIDPDRGFVHVLDDTTLDIVLTTLDTVSDFVAYLSKKEALLTGNIAISAAGEEELLAEYVALINKEGDHDFIFPKKLNFILLPEGGWAKFLASTEREAQLAANRVSYLWDGLIERFAGHLLAGTQYIPAERFRTSRNISEHEKSYRWLARENRTRRRLLARSLVSLIEQTPANYRATRVMKPSRPGDPYFAFLLLPRVPTVSDSEYREARGSLLGACCQITKLMFPDAKHIIGLATESGTIDSGRSEDFCHLDASEWSEEMNEHAKSLQRDQNLLTNTKTFAGREFEYPKKSKNQPTHRNISRNSPCYCQSGKRYKRCHGAGLFTKKRRRFEESEEIED
jgi:hypothetical protein